LEEYKPGACRLSEPESKKNLNLSFDVPWASN
jgi:hypothetical protein